jgi:predicted nucleotidyltransferase
MVDQTVIDTAIRYLQVIPESIGMKKAYLFGSYAKGNATNDSDIDIAIVVDEMDNFFALQMQLMRLRRSVDLRIEPHPFWEGDFNNQNPYAFEIEQTGVELNF